MVESFEVKQLAEVKKEFRQQPVNWRNAKRCVYVPEIGVRKEWSVYGTFSAYNSAAGFAKTLVGSAYFAATSVYRINAVRAYNPLWF